MADLDRQQFGGKFISREQIEQRIESGRKLHELIGRFVIHFEHSCWYIRGCIHTMFKEPVRVDVEWRNIAIILADLSASELRKKLDSLIAENLQESEFFRVNKVLSTKFDKIIQLRNEIVHGLVLDHAILSPFANEFESPGEFVFTKPRNSKSTGLEYGKKTIELKDIEDLNNANEEIQFAYLTLYNKLNSRNTPPNDNLDEGWFEHIRQIKIPPRFS